MATNSNDPKVSEEKDLVDSEEPVEHLKLDFPYLAAFVDIEQKGSEEMTGEEVPTIVLIFKLKILYLFPKMQITTKMQRVIGLSIALKDLVGQTLRQRVI
jgi:hypothetical protein